MKTVHVPIISLFLVFLVSVTFLTGCTDSGGSAQNPIGYDLYVNDDFSAGTDGWDETHFNSIQSAINKCQQNDSIYVYSGLYSENIIIEKYVELYGEDVQSTIIVGLDDSKDIIYINDTGRATISGFTFTNRTEITNPKDDLAGIDIRSDNNTITDNLFKNLGTGIYTTYTDKNNFSHNVFVNAKKYGILAYTYSKYTEITYNLFENNSYALRIKGTSYTNVSNNIFINNTRGVYVCCGSYDNRIYSNSFINNFQYHVSDAYENTYDIHGKGNYWDTFHTIDQGANDTDQDGIVDTPYNISNGSNMDNYPLVNPPLIDTLKIE